jgi:hypothetical protein
VDILLVDIGAYFRLNYHKLLVVISGYFINGQWWLLMVILLLAIGAYFINGYW